jgi:O-antigen/teichoic acid export membrane protein
MTTELHHLKRRAIFSAGWTLARIGSDQGFSFVIFVLLARLLDPHAMGVFALALAISEFGKLIASAGFPDAVIREPHLDQELADGIFWANFLFGLAVFGLLVASSPAIGAFFHEPELQPIVCVLAVLVPFSALGSIHTARTLRDFGHRSLAMRSLISNFLGGCVALLAAWRGAGAWSMVLQRIVVETVLLLSAWQAYRWLPRWHLPLPRLRGVFSFSLNLMVSQVVLMAMMRSQDVIIGRVLNVAAVGLYRLGWRAIDLLIQLSVAPLASIALPTLSRLHHDRVAFGHAVMRFNAVIAMVACPLMLCFGALAPKLVPLVFGSKWAGAGEVAQVLSLLALPYATSSLTAPVFSALGRSRLNLNLALLQLAVALPVIWFAAPYGALAVAIAYVIRGYLMWPVQMVLMLRQIQMPARVLFDEVWLPIASALLAGLFALLVQRPIGAPLAAVAAGGGAFFVTYVALLRWWGRDYLDAHWHAFKSLRRADPTPINEVALNTAAQEGP